MENHNTDNPGIRSSATEDPDFNDTADNAPGRYTDIKITQLDINKVREKTFNKELSGLVSRIITNESTGKTGTTEKETPMDDVPKPEDDPGITGDILLKKFHELFYKAVNLAGQGGITTAFNPFDLYKESSSDDLLNMIHNEMPGLSLPEYSILTYNPSKKCYTSYTNHIDDLDENNIAIDTTEDLYRKITENPDGIFLSYQTIDSDIFLKKRFIPKNYKDSTLNYYFLYFNDLFKNYYTTLEPDNKQEFADNLLPILMVRLSDDADTLNSKNLSHKIKNKMAVYLLLLLRKIQIETLKSQPRAYTGIFEFIETAYRKYDKHKDCLCMIIKYKYYVNLESFFILNYLHKKLKTELSGLASVSIIEKDKLILFTRKAHAKTLDKILNDFKKNYDNLFRMDIITDESIKNNLSLLNNIKNRVLD